MAASEPGRITLLLEQMRNGDRAAEESLIPLVYADLRKLARQRLRGERQNHTLQTTALVNEAYLRLAQSKDPKLVDRNHFFALAATLMRRILVDYARARIAGKRGGEAVAVPLTNQDVAAGGQSWDELLAVNQALTRLAALDERQARVVELRFFSGLELEEIAEVLGVSSRTVKRDWRMAQAWLYTEMSSRAPESRLP